MVQLRYKRQSLSIIDKMALFVNGLNGFTRCETTTGISRGGSVEYALQAPGYPLPGVHGRSCEFAPTIGARD